MRRTWNLLLSGELDNHDQQYPASLMWHEMGSDGMKGFSSSTELQKRISFNVDAQKSKFLLVIF